MRWEHPNYDKSTLLLGDLVLITLVAVTGWYLRTPDAGVSEHKGLSLLVIVPTFLASIYIFDLYSLSKLNGLGTLVKTALAISAASIFCYLFSHLAGWHNPVYTSLKFCSLVLPVATYVWRRAYFHSSRRFVLPKKLLLVGTARDAEILGTAIGAISPGYTLLGMLCTDLGKPQTSERVVGSALSPRWDVTAIGIPMSSSYFPGTAVAPALQRASSQSLPELSAENPAKVLDLGPATCENLLRVVAERGVEVIAVRSDAMTFELASVLTRMRFSGIQVYSLLDFCISASEELPLEMLNEFWLAVADGFDLLQARFFRRVKRLTDIFLATIGLLFSLPLLSVAAIAIKLNSRGPVLFRQQRVGWMGLSFELLKLRSMHLEAEKDGSPQWASLNDPRVTAVGRFLRKTHLDELPQLINVLRGEMSFVGPRPERPEFVRLLSESVDFYHLRHYVLPGITGWAQVNYQYGASIDDACRKLQYDLYYVCKASPLLDLRILLRTVRVVLFRHGSR